ncbi:MAG: hypothetical protein GY953_44620 [bacterium]|nr:hypothetical protein [bacterium]
MIRGALVVLVVNTGMAWAAEAPLEVPFFHQKKNGCGAASVAMVAHYWAGQYPNLKLTSAHPVKVYDQLYSTGRGGIRLSDMQRYLADSGFHSFTLRASWDDLNDHLAKQRPLIVCLKKGPKAALHYAVVTGIEGARVWLNDPTRRKPSTMRRSRFEKRWNSADRWVLLAVPRKPR